MSKYFDHKNANFLEPKVSEYSGHMVMTNVMKPLYKRYLNVDTRYRDDYMPLRPVNYTMTLPERVNEVKSVSVSHVEMPISFHNISNTLGNNAFNITMNNVTQTIVVPNGQYDISTLLTNINAQIGAIEALDTTNVKVPFKSVAFFVSNNFSQIGNASTSNTNVIINFDVNDLGATATNNDNLSFRLGWMLGFRDPTYTIPSGSSLSSTAFYDINGPRYLYLIIDEFKNSNPHSFITTLRKSELKNVLARITLDYRQYPYGSISHTNTEYGTLLSDKRVFPDPINIQRMNVQLVNERGIPMNLNGLDFSFCLELE